MRSAPTILMIDDDTALCQSVSALLSQNDMRCITLHDSSQIEQTLRLNQVDLILLDIILPGKLDGIALCKHLRQICSAPIIMLTGIQADIEKVLSLESGADNYLTKPFNSRVLLAHINASLRRQIPDSALHARTEGGFASADVQYHLLEFQGWTLNTDSRMLLSPDHKLVKLTSTEYILLQSLLQHPQCVLSRDQLLQSINIRSESYDRSIDILISRLRAKLEDKKSKSQLIQTVRNGGYMLSCFVQKSKISAPAWQALLTETTG